jgi:trehalose 6-phosphate phosphatase
VDEFVPLDKDERRMLSRVTSILQKIAAKHDGVWIEHKPAGVVLHTRRASASGTKAAAKRARRRIAEEIDDARLVVREGTQVIEYSVRSATKALAVNALRVRLHPDATFYAGDDQTDEDAFAVLGPHDVGVKSGDGPTAARFTVPGPEEVALVLAQLAELRAAR